MQKNKLKVILYAGFHDNAVIYAPKSPPIGLFRLKNFLERRDVVCDIVDLCLTKGDLKEKHVQDSFERISDGYYDVIGLSVDSEKMPKYLSMLRDFRSRVSKSGKKSMIVIGGQGGAHTWRDYIQQGKIDAVLLGFAEKSFYDLCISFSKNREKHVSFYAKNINGVAFPKNEDCNDFTKNPSKPLTKEEFQQYNYHEIKDLEIPYKTYWEYNRDEGAESLNFASEDPEVEEKKDTQKFFLETIRLYTSSHCPWKCGFCSSHSFLRMSNATVEEESRVPQKQKNGNVNMNELPTCKSQPHPVYRITPEQIYDLILRNYEKYKCRVVLFNDDALWDGSNEGRKHIMDLCDLIIEGKKRGRINEGVIFNCQAKVSDFVKSHKLHHELIIKLKKAGFYHFGIGMETFAERLLSVPSINKRGNVSLKEQELVIQGLLDYGFSPSTNIILFVPEITIDELFHVMKTSVKYMTKGAQVAMSPLLRAQEGSGITELVKKGLSPIKIKNTEWVNPTTKEIYKQPLYCIPLDKQLAAFIEQFNIREYDDMERISLDEQTKILKKSGWTSKVAPRPVTALSTYITISKFLKKESWAKYFEDAAYKILARNNYLAKTDDSLLAKESLIL